MSKRFMYVWEDVYEGLTQNWHSGGGAVVVAASLDVARSVLRSWKVEDTCKVFTEEPSFSTSVECDEDKVFIFPDAGCC